MKKKNKSFRLRAKKLFLTYSNVNKNLTKKEILKQLQEKIKNINFYIIAKEKHETGEPHFHVYLETSNIIDISNQNLLDLFFEEKKIHGNYQVAKRKNSIIGYLIKENDFICNQELPIKEGRLLSMEEHLLSILKTEGYTAAKNTLYNTYGEIALKRGQVYLKNLQEMSNTLIQEIDEKIKDERILPLSVFNLIPSDVKTKIYNWMVSGLKRGSFETALILYGKGGEGKTQLSRTIFNTLQIPFAEISEINQFKTEYIPEKHKGILIDNVDADQLSRIQVLNLIDNSGKAIRVLYGIIKIESGIPKIITTNDLLSYTKNGKKELLRRMLPVEIKNKLSSLFIQQNIKEEITINYNINNFEIKKENVKNFEKVFDLKEKDD